MADTLTVFVINLPQSQMRRIATQERLDRLGLTARFVEAIDGTDHADEVRAHRSGLTPRELGCLMSHCLVYEQVLAESLQMACVLEDDCLFLPSFAAVLAAAERTSAAWDVLLLGHHGPGRSEAVGADTCYRSLVKGDGFRIARVVEFPMGAYAYLATREGARKLLARARPPRMPADWVVGYSPAAGLRLCAVTPPCVVSDPALASPTTIDDRGGSKAPHRHPMTWRLWAGRAARHLRKAGLFPDSYAWRFR